MTVSSTTTKVSYSGDDSTTVFAYTFKIFADADLTVIVRTDATGAESTKTLTTDYTVSGAGEAGGGNVTMGTAPATGETLVIKRSLDLTQSTDYVANDPFPAAAHEDALDKLTFIAQQQQEVFDRAVVFPETDTADTTIPDSVTRAGKFLGFGASGEVAVLDSTGAAPSSVDTGTIIDGAVTTAKIADDAVTVAKININGEELVLDADGDTSITADTDDQIDFKTGGTDRLVIDSSGNVGIGATTVDRLLHIEDSNDTVYSSSDFDQAYNLMKIENTDGNTNRATGIQFLVGSNGSAAISATRTGSGQAALCFGTRGGGVRAERMRIDSSGNVGIGTSSPVQLLHLNATQPYLHMTSPATGATISDGFSLIVGQTLSEVILKQRENSHMRFDTNSTERMRIDSSGNLLVGYSSSNGAYKLQVNSQIFATSATIATSDGNYKENVTALDGALSLVSQLNPVQFDWKEHPVHEFDRNQPTIGFIAQEVQQVLAEQPYLNSIVKSNECVLEPEETDDEGNVIKEAVTEPFLGIAESNMVALLTAAIKEQQATITALEARVAALEGA